MLLNRIYFSLPNFSNLIIWVLLWLFRVFMIEWMKRTCPCFTPLRIALTESARETVSLPRLAMLSTRFFLFRTRDFTTFTLHDFTDFCIERPTAPRYYKLSFISAGQIQKLWTLALWARVPPRVSGALRSLCILRIGRIGSVPIKPQTFFSLVCAHLSFEEIFDSYQMNPFRRIIPICCMNMMTTF